MKAYAGRVVRAKGPKRRKLAFMIVATKLARVVFGILQNPAPFSPDLARPHQGSKEGAGGNFCLADRRVLRKAKRCLARAGEILNDNVLGLILSLRLPSTPQAGNCSRIAVKIKIWREEAI